MGLFSRNRARLLPSPRVEAIMLEEPCASCLDRGWHWVAFSGDLHDHRGSCLTPDCVPPEQFLEDA